MIRSTNLSSNQIKCIVESLLFVTETPLTVDQLLSILQSRKRDEMIEVLEELCREFNREHRGFYLEEVADGYQFRTSPQYADWIRRLRRERSQSLSRAALETLAIIAYRQPVARAEIEAIRGVEVGGILRSLLEKGLVHIMGRRDVPGRPLIYGTTSKFLEVFSLKNLSSLPTLPEVESLEKSNIDNRGAPYNLKEREKPRVDQPMDIDDSSENRGT